MEREEALERLKKKRTILRTSLSKYGKRIEEYDVHKECDHEELLGQLSDVYEELRRVDEEIGKLIDIKDLEKDLKMVEEYREKAVAWKYLLKKRSLVVAEGMQRETATATKKEYPGEISRPTLTGMVKLPKLTMERFYGEISQWLTFWNAFDSSINKNEYLTKIDKFNYLKAYLGGTAAQTVEGFCLSEENYDKAVELLKKRFGKRERLIDVHMNNLLALKPLRVTKDVGAFRELYGRILVQIRSLESLGVVVDSYGNLLCPLLLKLLPSDLKFELHREFTGAFSLGDLIEFLERQLIALESTFGTRDEITAGQPSNEHPQSQSSIVKYRRNERNPLPTAAGFLNASEADKEKVLDVEQAMDMRICDGSSLEIGMSEKPSVVGVTLMKGVDPASIKEDAEMVVSSEQMVKEPSKQIAVEESNKAQVVRERCAEDGEKAQVKKKSVVEVDESNRAEVEKESVEADKEKVLDVEQGMDSKNTEEVKLLYVKQGTDLRMAERPYAEQGNEPKEDGVQDSENEPKGDGVKDSEAETKDNEVEDSGTAIEACESVSNSKAVAEGADQVEIADGEAESIDDIEERVVRVPASSKLMEAGQIGDAEFKVKGYYLPDRPVPEIAMEDNWATFVMNRVMEIRSLSETEDWCRVPGCLNPADLPSRGCLADSLERSKWWEGPSWLRRPRRDWPHREIYPDPDIVNSEKRKIVLKSTQLKGLVFRRDSGRTNPTCRFVYKMAEELILRLKKKRAVNRSYLTKTCNKIESGLDTLMRIELEELLEQLNESFNELKVVDHEIETLLETDDLEKELQGVEEYREKYITWRFRANKKIRQSDFQGENIPNSNSRIDENEMRHYVPSCTTVKLPKLMISKFYGNFSEWLTFWNSFDAAIHQNNSLNPIDKFNYLKSHLGRTALNTVEGFALSADNYEKAIKLLKDRFGREDILISRHMNNLLSMRPLKTSSDVRTFRELFDNLSVHIRSLESLNVSIDVYGQLLCPIIIKLLPADLNLELNKELPTGYVINDLITFLERQLTAREKSFRNEIGTGNESTSKPNLVNKHPKTRFYNEKPIATASELLNSVHKSNECVFCGKDNHGSPKCDFAANISLNEKRSLMKKKGVCYKCLRPSHLSKFCRNVVCCSICNMSSHLDVMCTKLILDRGGSSKSPTVQDETLANLSTSPDVLLPTLRVTLKGNRTEKTARAIIDTGSQRSYILHSTAMEMEYEQSRREFFRHSLFGGSSTDVVEHEVYTIHLSDINNSYRCEFEALGQPLICGSIPPVCPRSLLEGSEELDVSDLMRDRIEVLIGADIAGRLLTDDQRRISSGLVAIRTKLGWTVMGKIPPTEVRDDISSLCVTTLLSLDLENLWKLDAIGVSDAEVEKKTQSLQAEMEEHFAHTTTRDIEGCYEVALPWVQDKERIPSNKDLAENQLRSVRRKLEEVGDMKEYGQIFEEWMKQGIIEYAREDKLDGVHYLPHRPVYKRNSQTSRIRPVFNASARKRGKLSLNDCLDKGPNLIEIIPRLLNKFRKYEVGVSSDIEKAFLQIGIKEEDRDYLRFLWHTEDGRLITYRHKRVVFGITTSPYLLKATLSLHLDKAPEHLKITAEQLKSSFYVDNCLSSFQNVEETEKFVKESTELLSTACFNLRDWVSNVTDFSLMNQLNKEVNILGITWNTDRDTLTIGLEDFELIGPTTKRKVLSIASKIFDPLGVACPVTLIPKLILQETWIQKLTWDEVLPGCLVQRFWKWFTKLKHLPNIEIPRWLCFKDSYVEKTTLHIFCDASQFAYATCIFLRIEKEDRVDIQLIQARTRVAPLKKLTIPRLELLACLIGARLAANVIQDLEFEEIPRFYWTDSTNALCWIQREDNWAAFVMNRVKEIHNLSSPESWRHIPGRLNPADPPSRGCSAESLKETRWWEGPAWLKVSQEEWPKSTIIPDLEIVYSERRKTILNTLCTTRENENLFGRYSHFLRIVRITAWIYRFFNNAKIDRRKIISEDLSTEEITKSEIILIRLIQRESFSGHEDKKLQGFKLLVDSSGILRIKTKICRREDFANFRMPILLPSDHFLVSLLIRWNHETHGHAGLQTLLGILRENYWILRSRKTVKKIINQCIRCKRFTATPATVESTSLPEDRVRDAAVFEIVGVDLTGHLILKNKKKAWIVIFTCAVYRGVHLELVTSLSMEAFLQAFRRFIARRGRPLIVYSDNGTNFKGIANALKKIDFSRLKCDPTLKNITWKFIPPGAPWWGGWWERLIGMMKQLLFRILGQTSLGYEELSTVREVGVPDLDLIDNQTLSRKYQYIKRVREDLRERFRIEYFGFLRQETRRLKTTIPLKVGDMVLIGQESLKRLHWPLARIIQLYPGKDGLVRVAKVKTSSGDKIRPIQKLYNLEITPEIRCRDPLTERSPTQEVRLTTEEDPLTSQQEQHHIDTPNVVSSYGRPIKRPNRLDLLNFSFPCLSRRDANSK
ncbi:hypothetical protein LAZ67_10003636, partial [Cordylochernes scorpioides]